MADNVRSDAGEEREAASSGLLHSVEPLQGAATYKLAGDDSDSGKGGLLGDDSGGGKGGLLGDDSSDADGSDSDLIGDDSDSADADGTDATGARGGDTDGTDSLLGGDSDGTDASRASDADGSDAGGIAADGDETDDKMNPLGIADTNVDGGGDADASDSR